MRLKQLQAHGFKTFANRTTFLFNEGITAIVGPNGSGKSNVADAIRWALGEQSSSSLRTKKTEDLIFGGSSSRPRMGMAEVELTLENPFSLTEAAQPAAAPTNGHNGNENLARANVVDEILRAKPTEVTILRRAYRSGENEYLINRQRVRLRDLQELLQHWGLARNTYAVVGQGLIDAALALRPEERRALFEEAAGIGLYQSKKQSALEKLEETQQNLVRVNDIINEIAPRLPSLARQADRARKYDSVATALDEKLKQWYAFQWKRAQEHFSAAQRVEQEARERLNAQRALMHELAQRLGEARREAHALRARLAEQRRERASRESEYAARERELAILAERLRFTREQGQDAARELDSLLTELQTRAITITQAATALSQFEHQRARLLVRQRLAQERIAELESTRTSPAKDSTISDARDLARRLVELAEVLHLYEQALPAVAGLAARAQALAHHELTRRERERLLEQARDEFGESKTALALAERDVQAGQLAVENTRAVHTQLASQLDAKRARTEALSQQLEEFEAQRSSLAATVETLAHALDNIGAESSPDEKSLGASERLQNDLEEQEAAARSQLTLIEEEYNRAVLDAERSRAEIARLESEIEDDLGRVELDSGMPRQLRLRLVEARTRTGLTADESEETTDQAEGELITLPDVDALPDNFEKDIRRLKNQMKYIGNVNPNAPQEYEELKQRYTFLTEQATDLTQATERLHKAAAELDEIMKRRFKQTFDTINVEFKKYFTLLFGGGTARLELTDPQSLIQTGVEIIAKPPGKRAAHLAILSGGERSLTASALLFAILKSSPTPFCVLDEVDAMLDEANIGRFRDAVKGLAQDTQFIVITHNRGTIESATNVYGISMGDDGVSQVISMRLAEAVVNAPA